MNTFFKIARQADIDRFMESVYSDESIYPYLSTVRYMSKIEEPKNDWDSLIFVSTTNSAMLKIQIDRTRDVEFVVALWSKNSFASGKAIQLIKELVRRYRPRAINSFTHESNAKSNALNFKIFDRPWGVEESVAWNSLTGKYEDLIYFRKVL